MVDQQEPQFLSSPEFTELIQEGALAAVAVTKDLVVYQRVPIADAEDAVAQAFEEFSKKVRAGERIDSPRAWIRWKAKCRYIDEKRRQKRSMAVDDMEMLSTDEIDHRVSPEAVVELTDSTRRVLWLIDHLSPGQREVMRMIVLGQLRQVEIAEELDITPAAVSKRLAAARATLRTKLGDEGIADALAMEVSQVRAHRHTRGSKKTIQEGGGPSG